MSNPTDFEMMSIGGEFESAAEESERGSRRQVSATRARAWKRLPSKYAGKPARLPRRFSSVSGGIWPVVSGWNAAPIAPGPDYYRCVQECLQSAAAVPGVSRRPTFQNGSTDNTGVAASGDDAPTNTDQGSPEEETTMHQLTCQCARCQRGGPGFQVMGFQPAAGGERRRPDTYEAEGRSQFEGSYESEGEYEQEGEVATEGPFSEAQEIALAAELLSISSEAELEEFLGKLWRGIKKVGSTVGKLAAPFSGVLKAVAKRALPFVGGALGSLIPIPGVGTAVGTALGGALSNALEMELGEMESEDREFEMARRFVRIAGTAAQQLGNAAPDGPPEAAVSAALSAAAQQHLPHFAPLVRGAGLRMGGRWVRRGKTLIVIGA